MRISPSSSVTRMRARRSLSEACSQPSNLVYTTNEVSPESWGLSSSSIPKSVSLSPYSVQLSARTRAVHSTTPSHSLATEHRPVAVGLGKARGRRARLHFAGDVIQGELVRGAVCVGRARGDDLGYGAHRVACAQVHHPDALGPAALAGDRVGVHADGGPEVGDDHELVQPRTDDPHAGQLAALPVGLHGDNALAAAALRPVLGDGRALAEAALGEQEQIGRVVGDNVHRQDHVAFGERDALDTAGSAAHGARFGLLEADALAVAAYDHDLVALGGVADGDQLVVVGKVDGDDPVALQGRVVLQELRLLDDAVPGREQEVLRLLELLGRQHGGDVLALRERQQVGDVTPLGRPSHPRELVDLEAIHLALVGKEEHVVVGGRDKEVVDVVALFQLHPGDAHPAAALLAERVDGDALQVAAVGDGDDHLLLGDEVLDLEVHALFGRYGRPALVGEGRPDLLELLLDDAVHLRLVGQDAFEVLDLLPEVLVLALHLLALQRGEPLQPEVEDGLRLALGEFEVLYQVVARGLHAARTPDGGHHLVEVGERDEEAFEDVRPRLCPLQLVARPARHHLELVGDVVLEHLPVGERPRHAVHERHQVDPEALLHLGMLVEVVQHDLRHGLALQLDHDAHPVAVGLVAQIGDVLQLAVLDQLGDLLQEVALVDLVRDLRDHYLRPVALDLLGVRLGLHLHGATAGRDGVPDAAKADDHTPRRKVGTRDVLRYLLVIEVGVLDQGHRRVDDLAEVVGRDLGRHPHGDAVGAVDEQVRVAGRQYRGLAKALVEVRLEVDGVGAYVPEHLRRHTSHTRFRISHGRRRIAVHAPEVALAVYERIPQGEALRHADERVVRGLIAVGMVLADNLADDRRALAVGAVRLQAEIVH